MPRYVGRKNHNILWEAAALVLLALVVLLVLEVTGTTDLVGGIPFIVVA